MAEHQLKPMPKHPARRGFCEATARPSETGTANLQERPSPTMQRLPPSTPASSPTGTRRASGREEVSPRQEGRVAGLSTLPATRPAAHPQTPGLPYSTSDTLTVAQRAIMLGQDFRPQLSVPDAQSYHRSPTICDRNEAVGRRSPTQACGAQSPPTPAPRKGKGTASRSSSPSLQTQAANTTAGQSPIIIPRSLGKTPSAPDRTPPVARRRTISPSPTGIPVQESLEGYTSNPHRPHPLPRQAGLGVSQPSVECRSLQVYICDAAQRAFYHSELFYPTTRIKSFAYRLGLDDDEVAQHIGSGCPDDKDKGAFYNNVIATVMDIWRHRLRMPSMTDQDKIRCLTEKLSESDLGMLIPAPKGSGDAYLVSRIVRSELEVHKASTTYSEDSGLGSGGADVVVTARSIPETAGEEGDEDPYAEVMYDRKVSEF